MYEPDVTLTDYALFVEAGAFAVWLVRRGPRDALRPWWVLFFAGSAAAPLLGGTVHGFFPDPESPGQRVLWTGTLLALGATAWSGWVLAAHLALPPPWPRRVAWLAGAEAVAYAALVLAGARGFEVGVANYLPSALALFLAAVRSARRADAAGPAGLVTAGLGLTFAAAGIQHVRIALHAHFDHNALYHVVQAIALALIFAGARRGAALAHGGRSCSPDATS